MKDPERFLADLERPLPGEVVGAPVTEEDLERDAESFMAFTAALGVSPPPPAATA